MNQVAFHPLVILDKKPVLTGQRGQVVRFPGQMQPGQKEEEVEEGEEIEEGEILPEPRIQSMIIDKRKTSYLNRAQVLEKLRGEMIIQREIKGFVEPVIAESTIEKPDTAKIAKRLVIRPAAPPIVRELEPRIETETEEEEETKPLLKEEEEEEADVLEFPEPITETNPEPTKDLAEESVKPAEKKKLKLVPRKKEEGEGAPVDLTTAVIRTQAVADRLPKEREHIIVRAPTYYMNNRKIFIQKLTELFKPYQQDLLDADDTASCDRTSQSDEFELLTHQKVVRDYFNLYTPYRGLLLYFLLGTGKTCSAIAIAEGMKSNKRVFVLTPKSLKQNFFNEMKKCGDQLYKKNQYWEFVSVAGNPDYVPILSRALSLSTEYIKAEGGAWLVNIQKPANFTDLDTEQQKSVDKQLNEMIRTKYTDINYNGLNMRKLATLTGDFTRNPFDNSVIIVDEAHNFVSRIVNKIKKPKSLPYLLYDYLMDATNAKIVFLSGTPIINYPNEMGVLYNMLRGYIKTWQIPVTATEKLNTDALVNLLDEGGLRTFDYVDYSDNMLTITRNPFGFINAKKRGRAKGQGRVNDKGQVPVQGQGTTQKKRGGGGKAKTKKVRDESNEIAAQIKYEKQDIEPEEDVAILDTRDQNIYKGGKGDAFERYNGVQYDETGNISDDAFLTTVLKILKKNGLTVRDQGIELKKYKALPDDSEAFINMFVNADSGEVKNINVFQRRILGLTSYFRSANEKLLPSFVKTEAGDIYHVVKTEMSAHQFGIYEKIRKEEADKESRTKKRRLAAKNQEELFTISSTYRIFSRAACNFTFPTAIERPIPGLREDKEVDEAQFDKKSVIKSPENEPLDDLDPDEEEELEELATDPDQNKYEKRIEKAMEDLNIMAPDTNESLYLSQSALPDLSPKFAKVLENLSDPANEGLHLVYSHFRTIEGIGILRLILLANGFAEFKLKRVSDEWTLVEDEADKGKPRFALHTGTETDEEKEIILRAFNGDWDFLPSSIASSLRETAENNMYGEAIKVMMITASGAEGINLKNTRFVHVVEPYWHMVRVDQVIGRARRICSHASLPEELRTVKVFLYVATLSDVQKADEKNVELRIRDVSRIDKNTPITTDESLYEIASIKQKINNQILRAVKESAVDCNLYAFASAKKKTNAFEDEQLVCYGFGKVESNQFSSYPSLEKDQGEKAGLDVRRIRIKAIKVNIGGVEYALNEATNEVYDLDSYTRALELGTDPVLVGQLVKEGRNTKFVKV